MSEPSRQPTRPDAQDAARAREAEAILRRVRQETDPQIGAASGRIMTHAREHFAAADADQGDALEVLGTRIGRLLALAVFLILAASLVAFLLRS